MTTHVLEGMTSLFTAQSFDRTKAEIYTVTQR